MQTTNIIMTSTINTHKTRKAIDLLVIELRLADGFTRVLFIAIVVIVVVLAVLVMTVVVAVVVTVVVGVVVGATVVVDRTIPFKQSASQTTFSIELGIRI